MATAKIQSHQGSFETFFRENDEVAKKYQQIEPTTQVFSDLLIEKCAISHHNDDLHVFDLACGTGVVGVSIYAALPEEKWAKTKLLAGDVSESMISYLQKKGQREGWTGLDARVFNGGSDSDWSSLKPDSFTHIFVSFAISILPPSALQQCRSKLQPNGIFALTSWTSVGWYPYLERAVALVSSSPGYGDTPIRLPTQEQFLARVSAGRPWTTPQGVKSILQEEGFREIEVDVQKRVVEAGAPVAVVELMSMPIGMISKQWGGEGATEDVRNQVTKEVSGKLLELFQGEFEEQGPVKLKWEAILAVGRK